MINKFFYPLQQHAAVIALLLRRDTALQVFAVVAISAVCVLGDRVFIAMFILPLILVLELWIALVSVHVQKLGKKAPPRLLAQLWLQTALNAGVYAIPGVVLMGHPSVALTLSGAFWLLGMHVNIANTWARFPLFSIAMNSVTFLMLVAGLLAAARTEHTASPASHWLVAFVIVAMYIYNGFETLRRQTATEVLLGKMRRDADTRLDELENLHRTDALTGLLNRGAFDEALLRQLNEATDNTGCIAVFLIDLDSFKPINDTYSHEAGDHVLRVSARRIAEILGPRAIIGRLGGDEFICALPRIPDKARAMELGDAIQTSIAVPINWSDRVLRITASIGIALSTQVREKSVPGLCSAADQAMFRAKSMSNPKPALYDPQSFAPRMSARDRQRLSDALENGDLRPHYQPKVYLPTGEIIGFEALARWHHPERGVLAPADFLDQINEMGLQGAMLCRMALLVAKDIARFQEAGLDPGQVSLNVPEVALATHTGRQELEDILDKHPQSRGHLTFEITEDVFIARAAEAIQASVSAFRAQGIRISLDDFGTGFASFHHLRELEFDELKIDTNFVQSLGTDPTSEVLVQGFLSIASGLGVSVIAEGVETEAQRRDLLNLGCIAAQGYLFARALPFSNALEMLAGSQTVMRAPEATVPPLAAPTERDAP